MIKTAKELNVSVKNARLLTRDELNEYEDTIPEISSGLCWWLADVDPMDEDYIAYAEGNYTEDDMYCHKTENNPMLRVALDIAGDVEEGETFEYRGYIFTALSNELAISNNFLGMAKYFDEEIAGYIFSDEEITCTINAVIENMLTA